MLSPFSPYGESTWFEENEPDTLSATDWRSVLLLQFALQSIEVALLLLLHLLKGGETMFPNELCFSISQKILQMESCTKGPPGGVSQARWKEIEPSGVA